VSRPPALLSQLSIAFNSEMCPVTSGMTNRTSNLISLAIGLAAGRFETYSVHPRLIKRMPRPFSELTLSTAVGSGIFAGSNPFPSSRIRIDSPLHNVGQRFAKRDFYVAVIAGNAMTCPIEGYESGYKR